MLSVQVDLHVPSSIRDRQIHTSKRLELHQRMISSQPLIRKSTIRGEGPCVENAVRDAALSQPLLVFIRKVGTGIEALGKVLHVHVLDFSKKKLSPVESDFKNRYWYSMGMQRRAKNSALWLLATQGLLGAGFKTAYDFS